MTEEVHDFFPHDHRRLIAEKVEEDPNCSLYRCSPPAIRPDGHEYEWVRVWKNSDHAPEIIDGVIDIGVVDGNTDEPLIDMGYEPEED